MRLVALAPALVRCGPMLGEQSGAETRSAKVGRDADATLVEAVARGERDALGALYDLHAPIVMGLARKMLRDQAAAEDLVHDVFIEVWQHAAEFDPARGSVRSWIVVRARSRALDRLGRGTRDARAALRLSLDVEGSAATPGGERAADGARMRSALDDLPAELRVVLDLAYFEGLSASESAERLEIPVGTVKSRLARALEHLRRGLLSSSEGDA
jgi:RNA polymerase sigma-70 factor (ECF subfamily)